MQVENRISLTEILVNGEDIRIVSRFLYCGRRSLNSASRMFPSRLIERRAAGGPEQRLAVDETAFGHRKIGIVELQKDNDTLQSAVADVW